MTVAGPAERVHPSRDDPFVSGLSECVGGPAGVRIVPHAWWTPARVLLALVTVVCALAVTWAHFWRVSATLSGSMGFMAFALAATGFTTLALATTWLLAGVRAHRPWDAAAFAVAPLLLFWGPAAWDVVGTGVLAWPLLAGALWTWARGRRAWAGTLLVLAVVVVLRTVVAHQGAGDAPDGSWWLVLQQVRGDWLPTRGVWAGVSVLVVAWCAGVLVLGVRASRRPRFAQVLFLVAGGVLLALPVNPAAYALLLLPLAALARPRWRDLVVWQAAELVHAVMHGWYLDGLLHPVGEGSAVLYWLAVLARVAGLMWLMGTVVRDVVRPQSDPVRLSRP